MAIIPEPEKLENNFRNRRYKIVKNLSTVNFMEFVCILPGKRTRQMTTQGQSALSEY